jgi:hypothetical protein
LAEGTNVLVFINNTDSTGNTGTNLVSFFPDVHLENINEMLKTNGIECLIDVSSRVPTRGNEALLKPPVCWVSIFNHSTDFIGCLNMSATNLCRIALLDQQGHQVPKTKSGEMYGETLSQEQITEWRHNWNYPHRRMLRRLIPNGLPKYADAPTEIDSFGIKDAFEIKTAGEYELHLQMRLIQVGIDSSGKFYYPVTWLREVVAKVEIRPEDISPPDLQSNIQTNSAAK